MRTRATYCASRLLILSGLLLAAASAGYAELALPRDAAGATAPEGVKGHGRSAGSGRTFTFSRVPLEAALDTLMRLFPVSIVYLDADVRGKVVTASCNDCGFEDALATVLQGSGLSWIRMGSQVVLKPAPAPPPPQPAATIWGTIADSVTKEPLTNAAVYLKEEGGRLRQWCPANAGGFYSLRKVPPGDYTILVRALGYRAVSRSLSINSPATAGSLRQDILLPPNAITMQEVTVEGLRLPLTSAEGFARGLYIRSTPSDQNQYMLDGARIYNPAHFAGLLSSFNQEALNEVQTALGGIPPAYGGRIGSIMDLSMRDGSRERLTGAAGTGSLGSHLAFEGPLFSATSFLLSGRRSYPDAKVPFLGKEQTPGRLGASELTVKISHRLSGSSRLLLSGYAGADTYDNNVADGARLLQNDFAWTNSALNVRWMGIVSSSLFLQASAAYSRYGFTLRHVLNDPNPVVPGNRALSDYAIEDFAVRLHAEHFYDADHTLRGGAELIQHRIGGGISAFSTQLAPLAFGSSPVWELAVYLEDQWRLLPWVTAGLGARAATFTGPGATYSAIDPRFSLLVRLNETSSLYGSLGAVNQFLHPYRNSGLFMLYPAIFWYPSDANVKPSTALQASLGFEKESQDEVYSASFEPYYRVIQNLHEFLPTVPQAGSVQLKDAIVYGTGKSYGTMVTLRKRSGTISGMVTYTLSWSRNRFAEVNGGALFNARFDRRHELQVELLYRPSDAWMFSAGCVIASKEHPAELKATAAPAGTGTDPGFQGGSRGIEGLGATSIFSLVDLNGNRSPGFQRLELRAQRAFALGSFPCQVTLRLLNGYGLLDPFAWRLLSSSDPRYQWTAEVNDLPLFPVYPVLDLSVGF